MVKKGEPGRVYVARDKNGRVIIGQARGSERMPTTYSCQVPDAEIWEHAIKEAFAPYRQGGNVFQVELMQAIAILEALSQTFEQGQDGASAPNQEILDWAEKMLNTLEDAIGNLSIVGQRHSPNAGSGSAPANAARSRDTSSHQRSQLEAIKNLLRQFKREFAELSATARGADESGGALIDVSPVPVSPPPPGGYNTGTGRESRDSLSFEQMDIPEGGELCYRYAHAKAKPVYATKINLRTHRKVKTQGGRVVSFSQLTKKLTRYPRVSPNLYWTYNGTLLSDLFDQYYDRQEGK